MQAPYIPSPDADFALWLDNFATLIAADPTDYGLIAGDATAISAVNTDFQASFLLATNPATRTSATIAQKDADRAAATATVRPYAVQISRNMAVSDLLKTGVGVNLPNSTRTAIPTPLTSPVLMLASAAPGFHNLGYEDATTPGSKAKPFGAIGMEIFVKIGTAPVSDPAEATYLLTGTKSPLQISHSGGDAGKWASYFARWVTRSGVGGISSAGPFSAPLSAVIM